MSTLIRSFRGFAADQQGCTSQEKQLTGADWLTDQAESRGIPVDLVHANFRWIEGREAVEVLAESAVCELQRVNSYVTKPTQRLLDRYEFAALGGILAYGGTLDGQPGQVAYFKPIRPRLDFEQKKLIKYETPAKQPAAPLLPWVPDYYAQKIFDRFQIKPESGEAFWQTVERCNLPIAITEGLFKALALIAHGIPAIALRGIDCGFKKGTVEPHDQISYFLSPGREVHLFFDQDSKPKTVARVCRAMLKLGGAIESQGCSVKIAGWDGSRGKGIDDYLVTFGTDSQRAFDLVISSAPTFEEWSKSKHKDGLLRLWKTLETLDVTPERETEGQYLPELPDLEQGAIHIISSPTGTGKTTRLKKWIAAGYFVLVISPLNSLGKQSAQDWGLPHRHDCGNSREQQEAFRLLVRHAHGVVACIDSLSRLREFIDEDTPLLIVIDECNQVLESLNLGGTLKTRQAEILEIFAQSLKIAARNGAIVLSEARVNQRTVNNVKTLSGCEKVRLIKHEAQRPGWDISIASGDVSGFVHEIVQDLSENKKLIIHVTSRNWGRKLEKLINQSLPGKTILRIDSETNQSGNFDEFWREPDEYLVNLPEFPDMLILSPSGKSGVSITEPGFDTVYGLFSCHNPSTWIQMVARYRLPVPRRIWCPALIPANSSDEGVRSIRKVKQRLAADQEGYRKLFGIAAAIDEVAPEIKTIEEAQRDFYAAHQTSIGIEKSYPVEILTQLLENEGHDIHPGVFVDCHTDRETKELLKAVQKEIWCEDADSIAFADPDDLTVEDAHEWLNSTDLTTEKRWKALKVLWRDEFPGIDFDDTDDCYAALTENFGSLRKGVLLQVKATNLDVVKGIDAETAVSVLEKRIKLPHQLPRSFLRAALIQQTGILTLLDGNPYQESDERVQAIKTKALKWASEIYNHFTLSIKPDQTGIEIASKLLRKLGLKAEVIHKPGRRGAQVRIWGISDLCDPIRIKLLKAATQKVGGDLNSIIENYPERYWQTLQAAKADRIAAVKHNKNRAESWLIKTSKWAAGRTDKLKRLQEKLTSAIEKDSNPQWIEKLESWVNKAQEKAKNLIVLAGRADQRLGWISEKLEAVGGQST